MQKPESPAAKNIRFTQMHGVLWVLTVSFSVRKVSSQRRNIIENYA